MLVVEMNINPKFQHSKYKYQNLQTEHWKSLILVLEDQNEMIENIGSSEACRVIRSSFTWSLKWHKIWIWSHIHEEVPIVKIWNL